MEEILQTLATAPSELTGQYIGFLRYAVPVMTFLLLLRCAFPLLTFRREPEIWAWQPRAGKPGKRPKVLSV